MSEWQQRAEDGTTHPLGYDIEWEGGGSRVHWAAPSALQRAEIRKGGWVGVEQQAGGVFLQGPLWDEMVSAGMFSGHYGSSTQESKLSLKMSCKWFQHAAGKTHPQIYTRDRSIMF